MVSAATLIEDGQSSHNLATCFPPEDVRRLIMGEDKERGEEEVCEQGGEGDDGVGRAGCEDGLGSEAWMGGGFTFRVVEEGAGEVVAQVALRLCPFMVSDVKRGEHELSVCAIFRDQAPYLAEWVEYHLLAGVQHFYLYNHKSADNASSELGPYVRAGVVDLHQWDLPGHPQKEAFLHCTHKYGHESQWMAMIDVDEFLLAGDGMTRDVKEVVRHFDFEGQLLYVQEMFYGHQGFETPPAGLVIENYLNHSDDIAKFEYRKKYIFRPAEGHIYVPCIHDIANGYFEPSLLPPDVLRINHYTVKSKRHWAGDHIKRYQPCTDEWNEQRSTAIRDAFLADLRLSYCARLGRLPCGPSVHKIEIRGSANVKGDTTSPTSSTAAVNATPSSITSSGASSSLLASAAYDACVRALHLCDGGLEVAGGGRGGGESEGDHGGSGRENSEGVADADGMDGVHGEGDGGEGMGATRLRLLPLDSAAATAFEGCRECGGEDVAAAWSEEALARWLECRGAGQELVGAIRQGGMLVAELREVIFCDIVRVFVCAGAYLLGSIPPPQQIRIKRGRLTCTITSACG